MGENRVLVTGCAGFIGFHLALKYLERGDRVVGIDNLNDYYDVSLKETRLKELEPFRDFTFLRLDVADRIAMERHFSENAFDRVIHMAAQAGVRYSIEDPHAYAQSNLVGFLNVLEGCRHSKTPHLVYASSSSVYGLNAKMPFSVGDMTDSPASLYGATKKSNELMAHAYSHLYGIPATGLRFFTVYGPWGRPDMALFKFTKAIIDGTPIDVYGEGQMSRDFTFIDDVVQGVIRISDHIPSPLGGEACPEPFDSLSLAQDKLRRRGQGEGCPHCKLYNIGNHSPVRLLDFIGAIEEALGKKARLNFMPMQKGDIPATHADVGDLLKDVGFAPKTPIAVGIRKFVDWYRSYYRWSPQGKP